MFKTLKNDIPASIVVGIALASGAPLFSGLISGIIGGIVVGYLSGSKIGVSGPAAGLAAIVLAAIGTLGGYENFLVAVVLGGCIQLLFGILRAGIIGYFFPSSVIKGMLTGIGIIIILKQIPHFLGYDADPIGDEAFLQTDSENSFSELTNAINNIIPGSLIIGITGLLVILLWDKVLSKKAKFFTIIQGPFVAVVLGIVFFIVTQNHSTLSISQSHLVNVPIPDSLSSFLGQLTFPNFGVITNSDVWLVAFTIALVASLETLLSVEATDKLDPEKNVTPTNRELLAQGTGNILSGLIGGLPITQVIVRSSANIQSGGKSKLSTIIHGFLLLISVLLIPRLLNKIPLSVLAAILLVVGYKLAKPSLFKTMYQLGWKQFIPFVITIIGIVFLDLLKGIGLGLTVGIVIILIKSYQNSHFLHKETDVNDKNHLKITLAEEVTFFNKGAILNELDKIPHNAHLEIDVRKTQYLDFDIIDILEDFIIKARERHIEITVISTQKTVQNPQSFIKFFDEIAPKNKKNGK
jgi:MFS superfamily sulfate permease-like transporter